MTTNNAAAETEMRRSQVAGGIISAQAEIFRQQEAIREISAENEKLKKEIASVTGVPYDYVKADKYATLKGEVDALERRYQFEKMKKNELTKKYQLARIDLLQSRRLKGGVNAEKENAEAVQRQVEILENRLDQALTKFNDAISYNKELRDNIDIIREERRVFQRVYKKMEDDLRAKKKLMSERIEQSNKDLDERDGYLRQVEQLRKAINEQKQEYDGKVRELDAAMVEIKEMREEQQRLQLDLEARDYEFKNEPDSMLLTNTASSGELIGKRHGPFDDTGDSPLNDFNDNSDKDSVTDAEPDLNDVLNQLEEYSHGEDMNKLVKEYETLGETNFSLYKYVNELTTSTEELERDIRLLKAAIATEHDNEARQRRLIKELEGRLAETEELLENLQASAAQHREVLSNIRNVTEDVFKQIGCSTDKAKEVLGATTQCTESNHLQYLGLIEERATTIICAYQRHNNQHSMRKAIGGSQFNVKRAITQKEIAPTNIISNTHPNTNTADEDEDNALTLTVNSQNDEAGAAETGEARATPPTPVTHEETVTLEDAAGELPPFTPMIQMLDRPAISAALLVRQACLPSAHLGGEEGVEVVEEWDGDPVVSHAEIRRQMEQRLVSKREREERAQRRRRELKEQLSGQVPSPRKR